MPKDSTPLGDAMTHRFPEQQIPQPKPGRDGGATTRERGEANDTPSERLVSSRPALPDHPERMAADIEDEDADPVIDSGPGIADGVRSLRKQRG